MTDYVVTQATSYNARAFTTIAGDTLNVFADVVAAGTASGAGFARIDGTLFHNYANISSYGDAVVATGSSIYNSGNILVYGDAARAISAEGSALINYANIASQSRYVATVELNGSTFENDGHVSNGAGGLAIGGAQGGVTLNNFGVILGTIDIGSATGAASHIVNQYQIDGDIALHGDGDTIDNMGGIIGSVRHDGGQFSFHNYAYVDKDVVLSGSAVNLSNLGGNIAGSAILGGGDDHLVNAGHIGGIVDLGAGNDVLDDSRGSIDSAIHGGLGDDTITGDIGADVIYGDGTLDTTADGRDFIKGGFGDDLIFGGGGDDTLFGNQGSDSLKGGLGDDYLNGGQGNDRLYGNQGADLLKGGLGDDYLNGGQDNDKLYGNQGNDELHGGQGDDYLNGGVGDDVLFGEGGTNILDGGLGADRFVLSLSGHDTIGDFDATAGDKIDLSQIDAIAGKGSPLDHFIFAGDHFTGAAGQLILVQDDATHYTIEGDLNGDGAADFSAAIVSDHAIDAHAFLFG